MTVALTSSTRLLATIAAVLGVPESELSDETSPNTVPSWDSLNHLNLVMALEEEFDVELSPDDTMEMRDIACVRGVLRTKNVEV